MSDHPQQQHFSPRGLFLRVYWMALGNAVLFLAAIASGFKLFPGTIIGILIYSGIAVSLILSRYSDIRYYHGLTAEGDPATMHHWKRYSIYLLSYATVMLLAALFMGGLIIKK